jgi:hypothetical protein
MAPAPAVFKKDLLGSEDFFIVVLCCVGLKIANIPDIRTLKM